MHLPPFLLPWPKGNAEERRGLSKISFVSLASVVRTRVERNRLISPFLGGTCVNCIWIHLDPAQNSACRAKMFKNGSSLLWISVYVKYIGLMHVLCGTCQSAFRESPSSNGLQMSLDTTVSMGFTFVLFRWLKVVRNSIVRNDENQLKHQQEKPKQNQNKTKTKQENNSASSVKNRQQTLYLWKKSAENCHCCCWFSTVVS